MSDDSSLTDFFESDGDDGATPDAEGPGEDDAPAQDADAAGQNDADAADRTGSDAAGQDGGDVTGQDADDAAVQTADAAEPATVTYEWSDDETACEKCGDPTERRWRDTTEDGDALVVCAECKDW